ncbi:MAG: DUF1993 domain-containing protein [Dongiaceae bacterium]
MPLTIYQASVPVYVRLLRNLAGILDKAAAHAAAKKIDPAILISARLYPTMWSVAEQVRAACNHATRGPARLTGTPPPAFDGKDGTFEDLKARIAWAVAFAEDIPHSAFDGAEDREVVFPVGDHEERLSGRDYLLGFSMPNFYFHVTTAYDILRHNGVPLEKDDFVGS